jgi:hypothetical protein
MLTVYGNMHFKTGEFCTLDAPLLKKPQTFRSRTLGSPVPGSCPRLLSQALLLGFGSLVSKEFVI